MGECAYLNVVLILYRSYTSGYALERFAWGISIVEIAMIRIDGWWRQKVDIESE